MPARKKSFTSRNSGGAGNDDGMTTWRKELIEQALRKVHKKLESETVPTHSTISDLVQLLKAQKDLGLDEETPHEIRIVWDEMSLESSKED